MSVPPEVIDVVRRWVQKGEHDLVAATRILGIEEGCPHDTVCFHCQQVVEKYLKALLTLFGIPAPRTHDLEILHGLVPPEGRLSVPASHLASLNPYAVEARYADDWRNPGRQEALEALLIARAVRDKVRALLPAEATA